MSTPLQIEAWRQALTHHPDPAFQRYIIEGLSEGFHIGFDRRQPLQSARKNMPSAVQHHTVVSEYVANEKALGHFHGPMPKPQPNIHINRFGVIPKGHTLGKWRLITDLSFPPERSVNDGIDPALCSLSYVSVDTVAAAAAAFGPGALMAKVDIESAYRLIPVHPDDHCLLGVEWEDRVYYDTKLPFGLRSAPKIFNAVADGLEWCIRQRGVQCIFHYLDDYIVLGPPGSSRCEHDLNVLREVCRELGVPLALHKCEGPATRLTFLGIEIDTARGLLRLPAEKLERLRTLLQEWGDRKVCMRKELESLIGILNHACKVVRPGRSFLRRMIDLLTTTRGSAARQPHHRIRLNREFRADLAWWRTFAAVWNGVGLVPNVPTLADPEFASDASGAWGCGAWWQHRWFQLQWDEQAAQLPIVIKEMLLIVIAAAMWGRKWQGHLVTCHCDNQAVVAVLASRTSRLQHLMHLLRCLYFFEAYHGFQLKCIHIAGLKNDIADDLSRNNLSSYFSKVPEASPLPGVLPPSLMALLLSPQLDWVSPNWTQLFSSIISTV